MKVLIVADGDTKYGASHALCQMATRLQKKTDIDITVLVNQESAISESLKAGGCQVICVAYEPYYIGYPSHLWKLPFAYIIFGVKYLVKRLLLFDALNHQINLQSFDLIHSNSSREDVAALIAQKYHIPLIWHIREFGDLDYKCFSFRRNFIKFMDETAYLFIAVSKAVKEHWICKGLDSQKVVTVYDGIKPRHYPVIKRIDLYKKPTIHLVMTGSIQPTKGQEQAIKLLSSLKGQKPTFYLDFIGDGSKRYIKYLKQMIHNLNLNDSIRFLGYQNDVLKLLPNYDIGLMCSRCEGFGLVTVEYMMGGLAVLASDAGANRELVRNGIDGYLYKYNDIENMKMRLLKIIKENLGGEETIRYAVHNFSDTVNADNIYKIYKSVLNHGAFSNV